MSHALTRPHAGAVPTSATSTGLLELFADAVASKQPPRRRHRPVHRPQMQAEPFWRFGTSWALDRPAEAEPEPRMRVSSDGGDVLDLAAIGAFTSSVTG